MPVIKEIDELLASHDLQRPDLEILRPIEGRYTCLLMQPSGPIFADAARIGPLDPLFASQKGRNFLALAVARGAHIATTPEYFFPWQAVREALLQGVAPPMGALWILGCESISPQQLVEFKQAVAQVCLVDFEPLQHLPTHGVLLDAAIHIFHALTAQGGSRLVGIVQFKTTPSRDDLFLEEGVMKRGTTIWRFKGVSGHLSLLTLICSDVFGLSPDQITSIVDRSTIVHIQLNPDPRHSAYRAYRTTTFGIDPKASDCHVVCLNWAHSILQHGDAGPPAPWNNIGGSAWYCPTDSCSSADGVVVPNHRLGLYYTCLRKERRRHALFLNYEEAAYELLVPRLLVVGAPGVLVNRNGPSAVARYSWSEGAWTHAVVDAESGWTPLIDAYPDAKNALAQVLATQDALGVERVLALTAGDISGSDRWEDPMELDSFGVEADEIVFRLTFAQDTATKAYEFRNARLMRAADLANAVAVKPSWPPQVAGMDNQARISWSIPNKNFNVVTSAGVPTLVVHLGESPSARKLAEVPKVLVDLLRRAGGPYSKRVCILYRQFGQLHHVTPDVLTAFDSVPTPAADIGVAGLISRAPQ